MPILENLVAREVLDSRGHPTIEVEAWTESGARGRAIVATGGSVGAHEASPLRDSDRRRHGGRGVLRAVALLASEVAPALRGMDAADQSAIDARLIALDGTPDRSRLGANAILGASLAAAQAAAASRGEELHVHLNRLWRDRLGPGEDAAPSLPLPMAQVICGRAHVGRTLDFQDVLVIPVGARDFGEALTMIVEVHRAVGEVLHKHGHASHLVGCHGGYGLRFWSNAQAVDYVLEAILTAGMEIGRDVAVALDVAATHCQAPGSAAYELTVGRESHDASGMIAMLEHWTRQYPIASIEDGLGEDDWDGWVALTDRLGPTVQLVGDDLFAARSDRLRTGIDLGAANAVAIKLGQVATLTETLDAMALARRHGRRTIVAARAGDSEDTAAADLAVATGAGQVKLGGTCRSERLAKYNRLLRIGADLGHSARFAGRAALLAPADGNGEANRLGPKANEAPR